MKIHGPKSLIKFKRLFFSILSLIFLTPQILMAISIEEMVNKFGVDFVATQMSYDTNKSLPIRSGPYSTLTRLDYDKNEKELTGKYLIDKDYFEREAKLLKKNYPEIPEKDVDRFLDITSILKDTTMREIVKSRKKPFINHWCNHDNFAPLLKNGVKMTAIFEYYDTTNSFSVIQNDCLSNLKK